MIQYGVPDFDATAGKAISTAIRDAGLPADVDRDDFVQDCWVRILEARRAGTLDPEHPKLFTYICRLVENRIKDLYRRKPADHRLDEDRVDDRQDLERRIDSEEEQWNRDRISESMRSLSEADQTVLRLRMSGATYSEIGQRTGRRREAARKCFLRALSRLQSCLQPPSSGEA